MKSVIKPFRSNNAGFAYKWWDIWDKDGLAVSPSDRSVIAIKEKLSSEKR